MPYRTKITSSPMLTHPCPLCSRPTRRDGRCRTWNCLNRFPDPAEAREQALAEMRAITRNIRAHRHDKDTSDD